MQFCQFMEPLDFSSEHMPSSIGPGREISRRKSQASYKMGGMYYDATSLQIGADFNADKTIT